MKAGGIQDPSLEAAGFHDWIAYSILLVIPIRHVFNCWSVWSVSFLRALCDSSVLASKTVKCGPQKWNILRPNSSLKVWMWSMKEEGVLTFQQCL